MSSQKKVSIFGENESYIFECPHCDSMILVAFSEVNCQIFRHCIMKSTGQQVDPHASKDKCELLIVEDLVYGCCKPFKLIIGSDGCVSTAEKCEWI